MKRGTWVVAVALTAVLSACGPVSEQQDQVQPEPQATATPVELDPAEARTKGHDPENAAAVLVRAYEQALALRSGTMTQRRSVSIDDEEITGAEVEFAFDADARTALGRMTSHGVAIDVALVSDTLLLSGASSWGDPPNTWYVSPASADTAAGIGFGPDVTDAGALVHGLAEPVGPVVVESGDATTKTVTYRFGVKGETLRFLVPPTAQAELEAGMLGHGVQTAWAEVTQDGELVAMGVDTTNIVPRALWDLAEAEGIEYPQISGYTELSLSAGPGPVPAELPDPTAARPSHLLPADPFAVAAT